MQRSDDAGLERLYVTHEALTPISRSNDTWFGRYIGSQDAWRVPLKAGRGTPFISTQSAEGTATISLHQDGRGGRKASVAERIERTVLSGVTNTEFPHAFAAREEMRAWGLLHLNPSVLRQPSSMLAPQVIGLDGSNLPTALARIKAQDPLIMNDISRDLANLVPGILRIRLEEDQALNRYVLWAETQDGRSFSSRVLSDGTLRLLALVALKNDPQHRGVLCFEEPENGVRPFRLKNLVRLLREMTTDFSDPEQVNEPLRQLLVNTHSPVLASQPDVWLSLLFAHMTTRIQPGQHVLPLRVTQIDPVQPSPKLALELGISEQQEAYTVEQVIEYLYSADAGEAVAGLQTGAAA